MASKTASVLNAALLSQVLVCAQLTSDRAVPVFQFSLIDNGVYNPIYHIKLEREHDTLDLILKCTHPRWKKWKTLNEATVINFLSTHTNIPCPKLYAYDNVGRFGFEYILMSYVPGIPLSQVYNNLTFEQRKPYLLQIAKYFVEMQKDMKTVQDGRFQKYVPGFHEYIQLLKDERERIGYQEETLVLTHLDIAPKNIMIDPHTSRITGIIDWEWCTLSNFDEDFRRFTEPFSNMEEDAWENDQERELAIKTRGLWKGESERKYLLDQITSVYPIPDNDLYEHRKDHWYIARYALALVLYPDWFTDDRAKEEYEKRLETKVQEAFRRNGISFEQ